MSQIEPRTCTLRLAAAGRTEPCPGERCAFWEPGGAVIEGRCVIERLGLDVRRPEMNGELAHLGEEQARRVVSEAAARAEEVGVETQSVVLRGFPVEEICIAAEKFAPQFLVVGSHGWGAMKRALFGSVSTGVLHHATCPVLVVRGETAHSEAAGNGSREAAHA